jgi:hypothetical protein
MTTARGRHTDESAVTRAHYYSDVCGIPCGPPGEADRIILHAWDVGALAMPSALGERVHDRMRLVGASGPIFSHDTDRWTFLTRPHRLGGDLGLAARLNRFNAQLVPSGAEILLPSPADEDMGRRRWVVQPGDMFRPLMETLMSALGNATHVDISRTAPEVTNHV